MDGRLGKYQILERLGAGGFGIVYRARDSSLDRDVALKVLNRQLREGDVIRRRFLNEAKLAAGLTHPNIVVIHELGVEGDVPYIAMEYLPGHDLRRILDAGQRLELRQTLSIAIQVARALRHAHAHRVVHRDVKPENIRILPDGVVKLMDFGIAKATSEAAGSLTTTGNVVGSASYLSPEQARGERPTPASDVFSFGIVLYELLTGERPFASETLAGLIYRILTQEPAPIPERLAPPELRLLVEGCLKKQISERFGGFDPILQGLLQARQRLPATPVQTHEALAGLPRLEETQALTSVVSTGAVLPTAETLVLPRAETDPTERTGLLPAAPRGRSLRRIGAAGGLLLAVLAAAALWPAAPGRETPEPRERPGAAATAEMQPEVPRILQPEVLARTPVPSIPASAAALPASAASVPASAASVPASAASVPASAASVPASAASVTPVPRLTLRPAAPATRPAAPATRPAAPAPTATEPPQTALLQIVASEPCQVRINAEAPRALPFRPVELAAGVHRVHASCEGRKPMDLTIELRASELRKLELRPEPLGQGTLRILLKGAPWAYFTLDDGPEMQLPVPPLPLEEGRHSLIVYRPGYGSTRQEIEIRPEQETRIEVQLDPAP
jgi:hypothetical protein